MADKKALLNELKIDRDAPARPLRPLKWFIAIAVVGGLGFVAWAFGRQYLPAGVPEVQTVVVRAATAAASEGSVLDATGYVVARRQATVSSKTTGKVVEVLIEEGMTVAEGELLATLDASIPNARLALAESQLAASKATLAEIEVNIRQAALDLKRTAKLAEENLASQAELDRQTLAVEGLRARHERFGRDIAVAERSLEVQRQELDDMEIRAPFGGVVIAKAAQPGEMISPISAGGGFTRTGICTIVDMDSLEVEVDVNEAYINRVYPDQPVTVALNAYPDYRIPAQVIATIPAADRNKATVRVRIGFKERDPRILPDMGVKVAFLEPGDEAQERTAEVAEKYVLAPQAAVGRSGGAPYVWVVEEAPDDRSMLAWRDVTVGERQGSRIRITAGLDSGERIVARVAELPAGLSDGAAVSVAR